MMNPTNYINTPQHFINISLITSNTHTQSHMSEDDQIYQGSGTGKRVFKKRKKTWQT